MKTNKIYVGNVLDVLKTFPDNSINMVMTSPPYWALRNYKTAAQLWDGDKDCEHVWGEEIRMVSDGGPNGALDSHNKDIHFSATSNFCNKCGCWRGELGNEPTFDLYIKHLCDIFDEIKRVIREDGSIYVNIGDTYGTKSGSGFVNDNLNPKTEEEISDSTGIQEANELRGTTKEMHKNLCNIPARFSIEMQNRGWTLRNEIIWKKNNVMPSSASDRFTVDFEKVYFFTKNKKYYFKQQFDPYTEPLDRWGGEEVKEYHGKYHADGANTGENNKEPYKNNNPHIARIGYPERERSMRPNPLGKNKRTTWNINTKPYREAHFATFPLELCKTPIDAGCPLEQCSVCGKPKIYYKEVVGFGEVEKYDGNAIKDYESNGLPNASDTKRNILNSMSKISEFNNIATCDCNAPFEAGIVLDPFMGSGTTAIEAINQGKKYVGIELNEEYAKLAEKRIFEEFPYHNNNFFDEI